MDIDLSKIAESVIHLLRQSSPERKVTVAIQYNVKAYVDANLFRVVLTNLLGNAWKFTAGMENASVELGTVDSLDRIAESGIRNETVTDMIRQKRTVYFVRDNGAGFDQDYAAKMFWPFHRLHSEKEFPGTGIGLAIVDRIVRRHGGRVWAEGAMGKGTTVFFTVG